MGKSSINGPFSMAMLNNQRVIIQCLQMLAALVKRHVAVSRGVSNTCGVLGLLRRTGSWCFPARLLSCNESNHEVYRLIRELTLTRGNYYNMVLRLSKVIQAAFFPGFSPLFVVDVLNNLPLCLVSIFFSFLFSAIVDWSGWKLTTVKQLFDLYHVAQSRQQDMLSMQVCSLPFGWSGEIKLCTNSTVDHVSRRRVESTISGFEPYHDSCIGSWTRLSFELLNLC